MYYLYFSVSQSGTNEWYRDSDFVTWKLFFQVVPILVPDLRPRFSLWLMWGVKRYLTWLQVFKCYVEYQISRKIFRARTLVAHARYKIHLSTFQFSQLFEFSKFFKDPYKRNLWIKNWQMTFFSNKISKLLSCKILWPLPTCAHCCQFRKSKITTDRKNYILPHSLKDSNFMKIAIFSKQQNFIVWIFWFWKILI